MKNTGWKMDVLEAESNNLRRWQIFWKNEEKIKVSATPLRAPLRLSAVPLAVVHVSRWAPKPERQIKPWIKTCSVHLKNKFKTSCKNQKTTVWKNTEGNIRELKGKWKRRRFYLSKQHFLQKPVTIHLNNFFIIKFKDKSF